MVSLQETWNAEEAWVPRRYGYGYDEEPDPEDVELIELIDDVALVTEWRDAQDMPTGAPDIPFEKEELCPSDGLQGKVPDESHYHEATGNGGATVERTYRRAAVVIWPPTHRVLAQSGAEALVHALQVEAEGPTPNREYCLELATEAAHALPPGDWVYRSHVGLVDALVDLALVQGLELYLKVQQVPEAVAPHLPPALDLFKSDRAGLLLEAVIRRQGMEALPASINLLDQAMAWTGHEPKTWTGRVQTLLEIVGGPPGQTPWGSVAKLVFDPVRFTRLLCTVLTDYEYSSRLLSLAHAWPGRIPFDSAIMPSVVPLGSLAKPNWPGLPLWSKHVEAILRDRLAEPLKAPEDFQRDPPPEVCCDDCRELAPFMVDPDRGIWECRARQELRHHLETVIARNSLDLRTQTIRTGSPHGLLCTKTTASHNAAVERREIEKTALAEVVAALGLG
jgi:hypothetical protein